METQEEELTRLRAENAALKAPKPVAPLSASQKKAALELKYAQECRRETPLVTRGGVKQVKRGSGDCPDHSTNGKEGYSAGGADTVVA